MHKHLSKNKEKKHKLKQFSKKVSKSFSSSFIVNSVKNNCDFRQSYSKSYTKALSSKLQGLFPKVLKLRLAFAKKCENSVLSGALEGFYYMLLSLPLRTLGIFLLAYSLFIPPSTELILKCILVLASLMIIPVKKSIGECLNASKLLCFFYMESSKYPIQAHHSSHKAQSKGYSTAFLLGFISGLTAYGLNISYELLFYIATVILCLVFFNNPETGLLFTIMTLPFLDAKYVLFFEMVTLVSFLAKFFRAKRHIKFDVSDLLILCLTLITLFSALFNSSGVTSFDTALTYFAGFIFYVLVKNIIRSTDLANRCVSIVLYSSAIISVLNLCYAMLSSTRYGILLSVFTDAKPGAVSYFATAMSLGVYLSCIIPIAFSMLINTKRPEYLIITLLNLACIYTSCHTHFLYAAVFAILAVLCFHHKVWLAVIPFFKFICDSILSLLSLLPVFTVSQQAAGYSGTESGAQSIISIMKDHVIFGTGSGSESFDKMFSYYSSTSSTQALEEIPLYQRIITTVGIFGAFVCVIVIIQLLGKNFAYIISDEPKDTSVWAVSTGSFASCAVFLVGIFLGYPFSDTRILLMFWLVMTIGISCSQSSRNDYIQPFATEFYHHTYSES